MDAVRSSAGSPPPGGDPGKRLADAIAHQVDRLSALAEVPEQVELRLAPVLAEVRAARVAIEKANDKPVITDHQVKWTVVPALLAAWNVWQVLLLVAALGLGFGMHWWMTPTLTCQDQRGGVVCFYWKEAQTEPAKETQAPAKAQR